MKKNIITSIMALSLILGLFGISSISNAAVATVSAGANQSVTLPTSSANLIGYATASVDSSIVGYNWVQTSGPITAIITNPLSSSTSVSGLTTVGSYVFTLTASDNTVPTALTSSTSTTVTVNSAVDPLPPVKHFKSKLDINPNGKVNLTGSLEAINGTVLTVKVWGLTFTVNTENVKFEGQVKDLTTYKVGDSIMVKGSIDTAASTPTIKARAIKDLSLQTLKEKKDRDDYKKKYDKGENHENGKNKKNDR